MNTKDFLSLFGKDHLFSAYDYQKSMPAISNMKKLKEMRTLNREGYCVYFAVNSFSNEKRNNKNIKNVRAVWVDDDNPKKTHRKKWPLSPSIVVSTSKGKYQYYWLTETTNYSEFSLVMQTMVDKHGNDKGVIDLARVLRLPGFNHNKNIDNPQKVKIVGGSYKTYSWETITIAFPPAKELKGSTKKNGSYDKETARQAIKDSDNFHGSLRDRAMELANRSLDTEEIIGILQREMESVPEKDRDKRWQDRYSEAHLYECANSAVVKYESEGHEDTERYEFADISEHTAHVVADKLPIEIIAPPNTVIGELTNALYKTWWVPNIMVAGLSARSIIAYLAGGKYRSSIGDRVNMQQVAIGETGCGKDLMFNSFSSVMSQVFRDKDQLQLISNGIIDEIGSAEGIDLKLRLTGKKHDVIILQDEIGGLIQTAKKNTVKREILEYLLKMYTKSDAPVSERALIKKLPEKAASILYAPSVIVSGATTPKLITQGLDSTFLSYGSASRMVFFPVTQYVEKHIREIEKLKLSNEIKKILKEIYSQEDDGDMMKYPSKRIHNPCIVKFSKRAIDICHLKSLELAKKKGMEAEVWNRHVANSKKYAMIEAIAENNSSPVVNERVMKRNLELVASACEYSVSLFKSEVGETDSDVARNDILRIMGKYAKKDRVVKRADLSNLPKMRKLRTFEKKSLLDDMINDGILIEIKKENNRGKPTITYKLPDSDQN